MIALEKNNDAALLRVRQERVAGRFIADALRCPERTDHESQDDSRGDAYVQLSLARYTDFIRSIGRSTIADLKQNLEESEREARQNIANSMSEADNVRQGYLVCGYSLSLSVATYKASFGNPSVEDLKTTLLHPMTTQKTILHIARMENERNKIWEEWAGLIDSGYLLHKRLRSSPFEIRTDQDGYKYLAFTNHVMLGAVRDILDLELPPAETHEQCPAGRFLPLIWRDMVEESARDPRLFATDLVAGN